MPRLGVAQLEGMRGNKVVWSLPLPLRFATKPTDASSGSPQDAAPVPDPVPLKQLGPLSIGDTVWIAWGPVLRKVKLSNGQVLARLDLPADSVALEPFEGGVKLEVEFKSNVRQTFNVVADRALERMVYLPDPQITGALETLARAGLSFDPENPSSTAQNPKPTQIWAERSQKDSQNPFNLLFWGRALEKQGVISSDASSSSANTQAQQRFQQALELKVPFFVSIRLAKLLEDWDHPALADQALVAARQNWADLGYDAALNVSSEALFSYGNPLGEAQSLRQAGKTLRADMWMRFLRRFAPRFEGYEAVYQGYADELRGLGRDGEAQDWQNFTLELRQDTPYQLGPSALKMFQAVALLSSLLLVLSFLSISLSYWLRYLAQRQAALKKVGGLLGSWWRNPLMRLRHATLGYLTLSEKLVSITLLLALLGSLTLYSWASSIEFRSRHAVLGMGTYGGAWFYNGLEELSLSPQIPESYLLRGIASQLDGDLSAARTLYASQPTLASALNNLGTLEAGEQKPTQARENYRQALSLEPSLVAAAYNLGLSPTDNQAQFQRDLRSGPRLAYPTPNQLNLAIGGDFSDSLRQFAIRPLGFLRELLPWGWPPALQLALPLLFLWIVLLHAVSLLMSRPKTARLPPRPWSFRVLAVLIPGLGLIEEVWGLCLLLPWSALLVGLLGPHFGLSFELLFARQALLELMSSPWPWVFLALYLLNFLGLALEEWSYARKRRRLESGVPVTL